MDQVWTVRVKLGTRACGAIIGRVRARTAAREQRCRPGGVGEMADVTRAMIECARRQPATGVRLHDLHVAVLQAVTCAAADVPDRALTHAGQLGKLGLG